MDNWVKLKSDETLKSLGLLGTGIPFLGFSESWIDLDYNPEGVRECYSSFDDGIVSARYSDNQEAWLRENHSQPTHAMKYVKPNN